MANLVILESDAGELDDIDKRLTNDGYRSNISVEHKLRYIWRQLSRSETSLASSLQSVEELRKQHASEMIEVENYVTHIRQLSDEREALTQDLEAENEQLKAELEQVKIEREAGAFVSEEICDLLMESGLTQIGRDTNPVKEQMTFLLKERVGLLDKVHRLERESSSGQSNARLVEMMEEERKEMEEEMNRMREVNKQVKQEERKVHERELQAVNKEKDDIKAQLEKAQKQHSEDLAELIKRHQVEKMRLLEEKDEVKENMTASSSRTDRIVAEMEQIRLKMQTIEQEKVALQATVKSLEEEINQEKEEVKSSKLVQENTVKKLKSELSSSKQKLQETEVKLKTLEEGKKTVDKRLEMAQKDLENIRIREKKLSSEKDNLLTEGKSASQKHEYRIQQLAEENESLKMRLQSSEEAVDRHIKQIEGLTLQLGETERSLQEKEEDMEDLHKNPKNEMSTMRAKLERATEEATVTKDELNHSKQHYEKLLAEVKTEALAYHEKLSATEGHSKEVQGDRELLRTQIVDLRKDLEASLAASMTREKETMEQIAALEREKEGLARELASYISKDTTKSKQGEELNAKVQALEGEKASLQSVVAAQERQVAEIIGKLGRSDEKLAELENQLHKEKNNNTELSTKFQFTEESSSSAKQEATQLRDEVKALSGQLLRQHNASLDSQSRYEKLVAEMRNEIEREREKSSGERHSLASQLEQAMRESKDLSAILRQRDEELNAIRSDLSNVSNSGTKASTALEFESRLRGSLENRTAQLETELTKAWEQIKDLTEKLSTVETTKRHLEIELDKKTQQFRQAESTLHRRQAEFTAVVVSRDTAQRQAEEAEAKLAALRDEFEEVGNQLERTQLALKEASEKLMEMHLTSDENGTLRDQLYEEEVNKTIQQQTVQEFQRQVDLLRERNGQLQETIKEQDNNIKAMTQKLQITSEQHKLKANEGKDLTERVNELQQENEALKSELITAAQKIDSLQRKNDEKKSKAQAKIQSLRDRFAREKRNLESTILSLQSSLDLTQERVVKEEEWKGATAAVHKNLLEEKRGLLTKLTDCEEVIREHLRSLRQSEARLLALEKENLTLHSKVDLLTKEKSSISRELEKSKASSPFTSPQPSGPIDSQVLMSALARLRQNEAIDRSYSSPSPDLYSPDVRSPDRSLNFGNSLSSSINSGRLVTTGRGNVDTKVYN